MATDAFGLGGTPPEELLGLTENEEEEAQEPTVEEPETVAEETPERARDPETGRFVAQEAPSETQEAEETQSEPEEAEPALDQTEEQPAVEEEPQQEEAQEEEQPYLWAGKYQNPEELERGYNESREMWRRAMENKKAEEQRAYEAELRQQELAQILNEAIPYLQQAAAREQQWHAFAERVRQETGAYPEGYTGPPAQQQQGVAPGDVEQMVERRLAVERQRAYEEAQRVQEYQTLENAVNTFYQDHPEVEPRGALDNGITDAQQVLDNSEAWIANDEEVDMADLGTLEVLYEASQRPALLNVLSLKPEYFSSETGLQLARMEASVLEGAPEPTTTQQTRRVPASQVGSTAGQRKPFAESAVTGAEAEEEDDGSDPWAEIKREYAKSRNQGSVFTFE